MKRVLAGLLGVALALASLGPVFARPPQPDSLVITTADAGRVYGGRFVLEAASSVANAQASVIPTGYQQPTAAVYAKHGRITGYLTYLSKTHARSGPTQIFSDVDRYRTAAGPRWAVKYSGATGGATLRSGVIVTTHAVRNLGDAAYLAVYTQPQSTTSTHLLVLAFRRGDYLVTIGVGGRTGLSESAILSMARIIDHRITSAK